jgi:hypothetical protein
MTLFDERGNCTQGVSIEVQEADKSVGKIARDLFVGLKENGVPLAEIRSVAFMLMTSISTEAHFAVLKGQADKMGSQDDE